MIYEKLFTIQQELKAPKDLKNDFAHFQYRNAEGILEALKPLLAQTKTVCICNSVLQDGHIMTTASLIDVETGENVVATSCAREDEAKKGMDAPQMTGSAVSYSKKYALSNLFAIDDSKDDPDGRKDMGHNELTDALEAYAENHGITVSDAKIDVKDAGIKNTAEAIKWLNENLKPSKYERTNK